MKYYCSKCDQEIMFPVLVDQVLMGIKILCNKCTEAQYFVCPGCRSEYHKSEGTKLPCFNKCKTGCPDCTDGYIWVCEGCADMEGML